MSKLLIVTGISFLFMAGEIVGGYLSGSLAIITDAAHMLSDVAGFMISYFAIYMGSRPSNYQMSFGYHRAEVLGALASIMLIWGIIIYLFIEAVHRRNYANYCSCRIGVQLHLYLYFAFVQRWPRSRSRQLEQRQRLQRRNWRSQTQSLPLACFAWL
jgi:cation diffusion facilitator family transporter